ncbi:MAG: DNA methyltransferase [Cetobacterium sp.]
MIQKQEFKNGIVYQGDCIDVLDTVNIEFDHVLTDPPYGYLQHRIETNFDYKKLFDKIKMLSNRKTGIVIFGRGDLFFEWNLYLKTLGFIHKEDCGLYKKRHGSPFLKMSRNLEYFTIRGMDKFIINKVKIPITDEYNITDKQIADWHRRISCNSMYCQEVIKYLQDGTIEYNQISKSRENVTVSPNLLGNSTILSNIKSLIEGKILSNCIFSSRDILDKGISHPTIKPTSSLRYIIQAISNDGDTIFDPFLGSGSTAIACIETGRKFIAVELDNKYFDMACKRIEERESSYLF